MITITFLTSNRVIRVAEGSNLLRSAIREQVGLPFKCGGGICGTCRCRIEQGLEHTDKVKDKERKHLTEEDLAQGHRMACQTFVQGDVTVSWIPLAERKPRPKPPPAPVA
ncbi:MAG TPA: 2Fe-2S iron-sulfur cluster binding domain-containing protein [Burkholderiales bacterium]|jgi:ferredoxin|nr:2Fe-2S iron-sulfur cluster binding domain-containing protein [Burkholderiales bacterium]